MTIYLISELYPVNENDNSITHAIKDFADNWNEELIVFRPLQLGISNIRSIGVYIRHIKESPKQLGRRKIIFFLLVKIPFFRKYLYWIGKKHAFPPPDVIAGHSLMGNYVASSMSKHYEVPFSVGLHYYDIFNLAREKKAYEKVFRDCNLIACRSYNIQKRLNEITGNRFNHKTFVSHSGVEEEQIEEQTLFISKAKEFKNRKIHFITAARLDNYKNIDINIGVLARLKHDYRYTIIGDGPERSTLQEQIDQFQLSDKIEILGWKKRAEVLELFKQADVYLMISAPETFGLAYVEAMAKGCIVIGAYGWGIDGIVQNGHNGFLAEPKDEKSLERVIHEIVNLPAVKREEIAKATRSTVLELTRKKVADSYLMRLKEMTSK